MTSTTHDMETSHVNSTKDTWEFKYHHFKLLYLYIALPILLVPINLLAAFYDVSAIEWLHEHSWLFFIPIVVLAFMMFFCLVIMMAVSLHGKLFNTMVRMDHPHAGI